MFYFINNLSCRIIFVYLGTCIHLMKLNGVSEVENVLRVPIVNITNDNTVNSGFRTKIY